VHLAILSTVYSQYQLDFIAWVQVAIVEAWIETHSSEAEHTVTYHIYQEYHQ